MQARVETGLVEGGHVARPSFEPCIWRRTRIASAGARRYRSNDRPGCVFPDARGNAQAGEQIPRRITVHARTARGGALTASSGIRVAGRFSETGSGQTLIRPAVSGSARVWRGRFCHHVGRIWQWKTAPPAV